MEPPLSLPRPLLGPSRQGPRSGSCRGPLFGGSSGGFRSARRALLDKLLRRAIRTPLLPPPSFASGFLWPYHRRPCRSLSLAPVVAVKSCRPAGPSGGACLDLAHPPTLAAPAGPSARRILRRPLPRGAQQRPGEREWGFRRISERAPGPRPSSLVPRRFLLSPLVLPWLRFAQSVPIPLSALYSVHSGIQPAHPGPKLYFSWKIHGGVSS